MNTVSSSIRCLFLAFGLAGTSVAFATDAASATDLSGTTDASIAAVLRLVARHQMHPLQDVAYPAELTPEVIQATPLAEGIAWNYPWGVTLYGVLRSVDATGDTVARDFVLEHNRLVAREYAYLTRVQALGKDTWTPYLAQRKDIKVYGLLRLGNLDNCGAMGVAMLEPALRYPAEATPEEQEVFARLADWIVHRQERLPDGTFWRPTSTDQSATWPNGTIWADDLYMSCPYLVRWARYTHEPAHLTDAAHQVLNMAKRLQDADGLWFHAYSEIKHEHSPFKWGRANGWVLVATAEILSAMPADHPDRGALLDVFRRHVAGIKRVQAPSGLWRQVLDHPDLWEETSCSAMFTYAIARGANRGWLPPEDLGVARKAFAAICARFITADGAVNGTCQGTNIGLTLDYYAKRQRPDDDLHGRGVVLLAGTELLNPKPTAAP